MRILIICSSLEKGRDGVGDYSLKLGKWLDRNGCSVAIIAVNDKYISKNQLSGEVSVRLSSSLSSKSRFELLQNKINEFEPEILFLQYVPYAYHKKGMPLNFAKRIGSLSTSGEWVIMVHEPYIGGRLTAKGKFVKFAQQKALRRLVKKTAPRRVFTSIKKYEKALADINIVSSILPLFGNIAFAETPEKEAGDKVLGVFFGTHPKKEYFSLVKEGIEKAASSHLLSIALCGKTGNSEFYAYLKYSFRNKNIELQNIGELSEKNMSDLFSQSDFGIARISPDLIGKSGSAISLLEHGLKLWIPLAKTQGEISEEVLFRPDLCYSDLNELLADKSEAERISNLDKVGKLLLSQINLIS